MRSRKKEAMRDAAICCRVKSASDDNRRKGEGEDGERVLDLDREN
jgi:hypothetical protein